MWTLQALAEDHEVAFVTAAPLDARDWRELNAAYGTSIDPGRIRVVRTPRLPMVDGPRRLVHCQVAYFERFCHRIAPQFDLAVSAYNPIHFGIPAIQLIGDFSFDEVMRRRLAGGGNEPIRHRPGLLRSAYLSAGKWIAVPKPPLREWDNLVLANSAWAADQLVRHFGLLRPAVLHPPVPLAFSTGTKDRDPLGFVCLGRIVPEKEVERIIAILARVREAGFPVNLTIAGGFDESDYAKRIRRIIAGEGDWIRTPGFLDLGQKRSLLETSTFAIHACRIEAFGIAVAEMAAMGCVPVIPREGGAGEIVLDPKLKYGDDHEAVAILLELLRDPQRVRSISARLPAEMARFAPETFVRRLGECVAGLLTGTERREHETHPENLPAAH